MNQWQRDKRWSDRFLPEIKRHIGEHLIGEPPKEEDAERNTDLMVLRMDAVRIGCRIRKHKFLGPYGDQFTIRAGRPSGAKTELTKVIEGWGDYFFYGFSDPEERALSRWLLGDFRVFRVWHSRCLAAGRRPWKRRDNHDRSSTFHSYHVADIPGFVVASNWLARADAA